MGSPAPSRPWDHCRARTTMCWLDEGGDKHLEECKHRAGALLGECPSFVSVTLCDRDLQQLSLRRPVMCTCVCDYTGAGTWAGSWNRPPAYLDSI